jgi:superfamily II DNA/RNA helicase
MERSFEQAFAGFQFPLVVPDLWQQEAIRALRRGSDVVLCAPTGAGKTFVFENLITEHQFPSQGGQAVYTVPTRALANEKWRHWSQLGWKVGIATGDLATDLDAPILVATLETQRERLLAGDGPDLLVIDEFQMIGHRTRGLNYELAIALAPSRTRLLLMSGSVANPGTVGAWLERLGRPVTVVTSVERPVPLDEMPIEGLAVSAPRQVQNFWQRLALGVLASNLGPLLIFAPHRRAAEKIAWKIAEVLPEDDPITLGDPRLARACSSDLARLLRKRIAFHHSGLSYGERAALVEPLAKAGQLRVVVATLGLAAGINFSVRSVFVGETHYRDGPWEREVSPDELLQMVGRAGRRGLDDKGYVITARRSPRLADARPLELRRQNQLDWPTLLRRMHHAAKEGDSPFRAARELRDRLFSKQHIPLGFGASAGESGAANASGNLFDLRPTRNEITNAAGEWEIYDSTRQIESPLGAVLSWQKGAYRPASGDPAFVARFLPASARLSRLPNPPGGFRYYGWELPVATVDEHGVARLNRPARSLLRESAAASYSVAELEGLLPAILTESLAPALAITLVQRGPTLYAIGHLDMVPLPAYRDSAGALLHDPARREQLIEHGTHYTDETSGTAFEPVAGSPAQAWRQLGLIDDAGYPTARGQVFSLFQGGEGLAVAAVLEDLHYPLEEALLHLANLRAGHRFELDAVLSEALPPALRGGLGSSERLAAACLRSYGAADHPGYLEVGLPPAYGEGAAEVLSLHLGGKLNSLLAQAPSLPFGAGDVERCLVEWLSLLRHIRHAADLNVPRWSELRTLAAAELARHDHRSPLAELPRLPASVLQKRPQHRLSLRRW